MEPVVAHNQKRRDMHRDKIVPETKAKLTDVRQEIKRAEDQGKSGMLDKALLAELYAKEERLERKLRFWNIRSSDFTIEAAIQKGNHTKSLFISTHEASVVENIVAGRYSDGFSNEGPLCKMYSVSAHDRERVKDGENSSTEGICGTALLMGQPHITKSMFENTKMKKSGFVPRFLFSVIPSELQEETDVDPIDETHRRAYHSLVSHFLQTYWSRWEKLDEQEPQTVESLMVRLEYSKEALTAFREFRNSVVRSRYANRLDDLNSVIGRLKENAMRVAIVLHAAEHGATFKSEKISRQTALSAIAIVRWSFGQYLAFTEERHAQALNEVEEKILAVFKAAQKNTPDAAVYFSARQISRKLRSIIPTTAAAEKALNSLVNKSKLVPAQPESKGPRQHSTEYALV
jgi:Protein of unknown function (DUF3987)